MAGRRFAAVLVCACLLSPRGNVWALAAQAARPGTSVPAAGRPFHLGTSQAESPLFLPVSAIAPQPSGLVGDPGISSQAGLLAAIGYGRQSPADLAPAMAASPSASPLPELGTDAPRAQQGGRQTGELALALPRASDAQGIARGGAETVSQPLAAAVFAGHAALAQGIARALEAKPVAGASPYENRAWLDEVFSGARHNAFYPQHWPDSRGTEPEGKPGEARRADRPGEEGGEEAAPDFQRPSVAKIVSDLRVQLAADPAAAMKTAERLLDDPGERRYEVRISAVRTLASGNLPSAWGALTRELERGQSWAVRREAALTLGRRAMELPAEARSAAVRALGAGLADPNPSLRLAAAWTADKLGLASEAAAAADEIEEEAAPAGPTLVGRAASKAGSLLQALYPALFWAGVALLGAGVIAGIVALKLGPMLLALFFAFGPILLLIGFSVWMFKRQAGMRQPEKKQFDLRGERQTTRFSDVGGIDDATNELREIVDFLKRPERYRSRGAQMPKGVLLEGPPGTGKTLLAKAVAGEAGVPFFQISASEFVEMFVGVGASRVRDIFKVAKASQPAILFIDELDAVAKARGGMDSNSEREQTLNQILTEMDGFEKDNSIVVMAATNRAEALDDAILRPGRFDRRIYVGRPDVLGREAVLQIHARGVELSPAVDLQNVAKRTPGLAGAHLKNVVNEAAIMSVRRDADAVGQEDFRLAIDRATIGQARKLFLPHALKRRIAYHEAGHVMATVFGVGGSVSHKVTIIPHGSGALGYAESGDEEDGDRFLYSKTELRERLIVLLGGLVAEELIYGEWSTGPGNDLERATDIARLMVAALGMGESTGLLVSKKSGESPLAREASDATLREVDLEIRRLLDHAKAKVAVLMREQRAAFDALAAALLEKETLHQDEIEAILAPHRPAPAP